MLGARHAVGNSDGHILFGVDDIRRTDPFQDPAMVLVDRLDQNTSDFQLLQVQGDGTTLFPLLEGMPRKGLSVMSTLLYFGPLRLLLPSPGD